MRKLNLILLVLLAFSSMNIQAMDHSRASKRKRIHIDRLERWDHMTKHPDYIPLNATIEDNCIIVQFYTEEEQPITIQIKDVRGSIIFQDHIYTDNNDTYKIDLDCTKIGEYQLIYSDQYVKFGGKFEID